MCIRDSHCTDGELISDELAKEGLPVFVGPTLGSKSKAELRHKACPAMFLSDHTHS